MTTGLTSDLLIVPWLIDACKRSNYTASGYDLGKRTPTLQEVISEPFGQETGRPLEHSPWVLLWHRHMPEALRTTHPIEMDPIRAI